MGQHTLNLSLEGKKSKIKGFNIILIRYTYKGQHKRKSTEIEVKKKHWDIKTQMIKPEFQDNYTQETIDSIFDMKKQFNALRIGLREKKLNYHQVFDKLLKKGSHEVDLKKFLMTSPRCKKFTAKSKVKYLSYIKAVEKKLKLANHGFTTLTTDIIVDEVYCNEIYAILKESNLSANTIRNYLEKIDAISRQTDHLKNSVFKAEGLLPSLEDTSRDPVEFDSLMQGINEIKTLQDLEAYLFWLYSFCLLGLDATDIINLDENMLAFKGEKINNHYHPMADLTPTLEKMSEKVHLKFNRKKSKVPITMLYNLIPTLFIRDWLHYLIKITRPQYAYKGEDRIRLFNFKTLTPTLKDDMEGEKKKKKITDTYSDKQKRMFGGTIQQTRHTVTAQGQENGLTRMELDSQLGHAVKKGSLKHYLKTHQIPKDVNHMHIIEEFGTLKILDCLIEKTEKMTELVNSEDKSFVYWNFNKPSKHWDNNTLKVLQNIHREYYTLWSAEDEKRYQYLMSKTTKGKWGIVNGVNTKIEITENEFPEELKELVSKKRVLIEKKTKEINEKDHEEYAQWQIEEDERYRKTIGDEEYIINRYGKELEEGSKKRVTKSYP